MIWTDHYFIHRKSPYIFEVVKFSDGEFPERFATVNIRNRSVNFGFIHQPKQDTIDRYLEMVDLYVEQGMPTDRCYMFVDTGGIRWNRYGVDKTV